MNSEPLVSILVPVYGVEKYVGDCVDSIFAQTYKNIEVIFVNDCTPDASREIIERKISENPNISAQIIDNSRNMGSASTRNVGLRYASGDYICFVDSDDILPKDAISILITAAQIKGADIVRGNIERLYANGVRFAFSQQFPNDIIEFRCGLLNWGKYPMSVWGGVYRRSLLTQNNLLFFPNLNFGEDYGLTTRIAYVAKSVEIVNETVYLYRVNDLSMTQVYKEKNASDLIEISNRIKTFYESKPDYKIYEKALERGRARLKTIMLLQLSKELSPKYANVFPELKDFDLPCYLRLSLWAMEHNYRFLYKVLNRLKPLFRNT